MCTRPRDTNQNVSKTPHETPTISPTNGSGIKRVQMFIIVCGFSGHLASGADKKVAPFLVHILFASGKILIVFQCF